MSESHHLQQAPRGAQWELHRVRGNEPASRLQMEMPTEKWSLRAAHR